MLICPHSPWFPSQNAWYFIREDPEPSLNSSHFSYSILSMKFFSAAKEASLSGPFLYYCYDFDFEE